MIGIVDVAVQAHNPGMPLYPMKAYAGSPSSIRVRNVPRQIGSWKITNVVFTAVYPDGEVKSAQCVPVNNIWVGTIAGSNTTGATENGYTIFASGIDENGNQVNDYVLGKGDVEILDSSGVPTPSSYSYFVHLLSAESEDPKEGDLYPTLSGYMIWQNGEAHQLGGNSSGEYLPLSGGEMEGDINLDVGSWVDIGSEWQRIRLGCADGDSPAFCVESMEEPGYLNKYTFDDMDDHEFRPIPPREDRTGIMRSGDVYAALRYDLGPATVISAASQDSSGSTTMFDRAINKVAVATSLNQLCVVFPVAIDSKVRDFGLRVEVGTGSAALSAPSLVFVPADGETLAFETQDGTMPTLADGTASAKGVTLLYFTETAAGTFLVKGEQVKEVS